MPSSGWFLLQWLLLHHRLVTCWGLRLRCQDFLTKKETNAKIPCTCIPNIPKTILSIYMGVSNNRGTPKWMVYDGNPIKMDDLGVPLFSETPTCSTPSMVLSSNIMFMMFMSPRHDTFIAGRRKYQVPVPSQGNERWIQASAVAERLSMLKGKRFWGTHDPCQRFQNMKYCSIYKLGAFKTKQKNKWINMQR